MKKIFKVIAGAALAGCMLLPLAACDDTNDSADYSEDIAKLQQQVQNLQTELDSLKNEETPVDLFTGSPKFEYKIGETIPYYVNGTKIFDFKVTSLTHDSSSTLAKYTVTFIPSLKVQPETAFSALVYNATKNTTAVPYLITDTGMTYGDETGNERTLTFFYYGIPFASITATPTKK